MKLAEVNQCTGCWACVSACPKQCIHMVQDAAGFPYPAADAANCVNCGLCEKVCPVLNKIEPHGDAPVAFAAYSRDMATRLASSSGGIFSELARAVIAKGGAVYGAAYTEQFDVVHICAESKTELARLRGAKYVQSDLGNTFGEVKGRLEKGQQVLFSGTPCQVAGLKSFLQKEYNNLFTVDFVCHGVPSPAAWKEYVKYRAQQDNGGRLPTAINMRSKETGWSRYHYSNLFRYQNGSYIAKSDESLFMKLFVGDFISRASCAECHFKGYSRCSDLTIGDFWGIWEIAPEMDDDAGTSVLLCQSDRGAGLLKGISEKLILKEVTLEEASQYNKSMLTSSPPNPKRQNALDAIRKGKIAECEGWFLSTKRTLVQKLLFLANKLKQNKK